MGVESSTLPARQVNRLDAFLAWAALGGDFARTSIALQADEVELRRIAKEDRWSDKASPGSLGPVRNREASRAVDFVQATQLRRIIDGIIARLGSKDAADAEFREDFFKEYNPKGGANVSVKNLKILAETAAIASNLAARGLGDDAGQREADRAALAASGQQERAADMSAALAALEKNPRTTAIDLVRGSLAALPTA